MIILFKGELIIELSEMTKNELEIQDVRQTLSTNRIALSNCNWLGLKNISVTIMTWKDVTFDLLRDHVSDQSDTFLCTHFKTHSCAYSVVHGNINSSRLVTFNHATARFYDCVRLNVCMCLCMHELVCLYVMISGVIIGVDSEEINSVRVSICWTAREDSRRHTHTYPSVSARISTTDLFLSEVCVKWLLFCRW